MKRTQTQEIVQKEEYVVKSTLKERGWTEALIKKFYPIPDKTKPNPYYSSAAAPMKLYSLRKVEEIEKTDEFKKKLESAQKRQAAAETAIDTKINHLVDTVDSIEYKIEVLSRDKLLDRAKTHHDSISRKAFDRQKRYYEYLEEHGFNESDLDELNVQMEAVGIPDSFDKWYIQPCENDYNRICVNYLRHALSSYENDLRNRTASISRIIGIRNYRKEIIGDVTYQVIKNKILSIIAAEYPYLTEECQRQMIK